MMEKIIEWSFASVPKGHIDAKLRWSRHGYSYICMIFWSKVGKPYIYVGISISSCASVSNSRKLVPSRSDGIDDWWDDSYARYFLHQWPCKWEDWAVAWRPSFLMWFWSSRSQSHCRKNSLISAHKWRSCACNCWTSPPGNSRRRYSISDAR